MNGNPDKRHLLLVISQYSPAVLLEIDLVPIHEPGLSDSSGFIQVEQFSLCHLAVVFFFGEVIPPFLSLVQHLFPLAFICIFDHKMDLHWII